MEVYTLNFAEVIKVSDQIAEVIVNDGINLKIENVKDYHKLYKKIFEGEFGVIVNKKTDFSYSFEAMIEITKINNLQAIAVLDPNNNKLSSQNVVKSMLKDNTVKMQNFTKRETAINWINTQINKIKVK